MSFRTSEHGYFSVRKRAQSSTRDQTYREPTWKLQGRLWRINPSTVAGIKHTGKKKGPKIQGELSGALKEAGFGASQVYKF